MWKEIGLMLQNKRRKNMKKEDNSRNYAVEKEDNKRMKTDKHLVNSIRIGEQVQLVVLSRGC